MAKAAIRGAENFRFFADKCTDARDGLNSPATSTGTYRPGSDRPGRRDHAVEHAVHALDLEDRTALAAGCTVFTSRQWSPVTADLLARLVKQAGVPDGVLNTVHGIGEEAGKALTQHPAIKAIGFVGESSTGSAIMAQGAPTLKRVHFELAARTRRSYSMTPI